MMKYDLKLAESVFGKQFTDSEEVADLVFNLGLKNEYVKSFLNVQEKIWRKEKVTEEGREMYNETWIDVTDDYIERIKVCLLGTEDSRFSCGYVAKVDDNHKVIYLHGGKNGNGKWNEYLRDILSISNKLKNENYGNFNDVYLIKWNVDVADDVFYIWIGVN